jgi:hypothetical protein
MSLRVGFLLLHPLDATRKALAHAIADGSHYYTISYAPIDTAVDGKFRRIEIRASDRKYRLAYRRGYYALNTVQEGGLTKDALLPLLQHGLPNSTEIPLRVYLQTDPDVDAASGVAGTSVTAANKKELPFEASDRSGVGLPRP